MNTHVTSLARGAINLASSLNCIGTCGDCGGPVVVMMHGEWTNPKYGWCQACFHKPRIEVLPIHGPVIQMRAPDGPLAAALA